jgi:hypothetical protein
MLEAASAVTKESPKAQGGHVNGIPKAAGSFTRKSAENRQREQFRIPFNMGTSNFPKLLCDRTSIILNP